MAPEEHLAFTALADETRREILRFLAREGESPAGAIAAAVGTVGRSGISTHLRVLRTAGFVSERRDGRFRLYSLDRRAGDGVVEFLTSLYRASLEDLKQETEGAVEADGLQSAKVGRGRRRRR